MVYRTPKPNASLTRKLDELDDLRKRLVIATNQPSLWMGTLQRAALAIAVESSTAIEGFVVPQEDAIALVTGRKAVDTGDENRLAVACYGRAMDRIGAMADDPSFRWVDRVILDLHFDTCQFQRDKRPGRWRTGPIGVTDGGGRLVYRGPDERLVPGLMGEVVDWLQDGDLDAHVAVRAALAHLNVVRVHPFQDGNGRVSRIVQSLVLAREGALTPEFASIEEYLRENTSNYYAALQSTGETYSPERDASVWVEFCVDAHLSQARRRLRQIDEAGRRWMALESLAERRAWPDRMVIALEQALAAGGTDRALYTDEAGIATATATNDFRVLLESGWIEQEGRGRATRYRATEQLRREIG
jgi:Fic family protein